MREIEQKKEEMKVTNCFCDFLKTIAILVVFRAVSSNCVTQNKKNISKKYSDEPLHKEWEVISENDSSEELTRGDNNEIFSNEEKYGSSVVFDYIPSKSNFLRKPNNHDITVTTNRPLKEIGKPTEVEKQNNYNKALTTDRPLKEIEKLTVDKNPNNYDKTLITDRPTYDLRYTDLHLPPKRLHDDHDHSVKSETTKKKTDRPLKEIEKQTVDKNPNNYNEALTTDRPLKEIEKQMVDKNPNNYDKTLSTDRPLIEKPTVDKKQRNYDYMLTTDRPLKTVEKTKVCKKQNNCDKRTEYRQNIDQSTEYRPFRTEKKTTVAKKQNNYDKTFTTDRPLTEIEKQNVNTKQNNYNNDNTLTLDIPLNLLEKLTLDKETAVLAEETNNTERYKDTEYDNTDRPAIKIIIGTKHKTKQNVKDITETINGKKITDSEESIEKELDYVEMKLINESKSNKKSHVAYEKDNYTSEAPASDEKYDLKKSNYKSTSLNSQRGETVNNKQSVDDLNEPRPTKDDSYLTHGDVSKLYYLITNTTDVSINNRTEHESSAKKKNKQKELEIEINEIDVPTRRVVDIYDQTPKSTQKYIAIVKNYLEDDERRTVATPTKTNKGNPTVETNAMSEIENQSVDDLNEPRPTKDDSYFTRGDVSKLYYLTTNTTDVPINIRTEHDSSARKKFRQQEFEINEIDVPTRRVVDIYNNEIDVPTRRVVYIYDQTPKSTQKYISVIKSYLEDDERRTVSTPTKSDKIIPTVETNALPEKETESSEAYSIAWKHINVTPKPNKITTWIPVTPSIKVTTTTESSMSEPILDTTSQAETSEHVDTRSKAETSESIDTPLKTGTSKPVDTTSKAEASEPVDTTSKAEPSEPDDMTSKTVDTTSKADASEPVDTTSKANAFELVDMASKPIDTTSKVETSEPVDTVSKAEASELVDMTSKPVDTISKAETSEPVDTISKAETSEPVDTLPKTGTSKTIDTIFKAETSEPVDATSKAETSELVDTISKAETSEPVDTLPKTGTSKTIDTTSKAEASEPVDTRYKTETWVPADATGTSKLVDTTSKAEASEPLDTRYKTKTWVPADATGTSNPVYTTSKAEASEPVDKRFKTKTWVPADTISKTETSEPNDRKLSPETSAPILTTTESITRTVLIRKHKIEDNNKLRIENNNHKTHHNHQDEVHRKSYNKVHHLLKFVPIGESVASDNKVVVTSTLEPAKSYLNTSKTETLVISDSRVSTKKSAPISTTTESTARTVMVKTHKVEENNKLTIETNNHKTHHNHKDKEYHKSHNKVHHLLKFVPIRESLPPEVVTSTQEPAKPYQDETKFNQNVNETQDSHVHSSRRTHYVFKKHRKNSKKHKFTDKKSSDINKKLYKYTHTSKNISPKISQPQLLARNENRNTDDESSMRRMDVERENEVKKYLGNEDEFSFEKISGEIPAYAGQKKQNIRLGSGGLMDMWNVRYQDGRKHWKGGSFKFKNNKEVVDSSVADKLARKIRIVCWVMTSSEHNHRRAHSVKATWGKRCTVLLFISDVDDSSLPAMKMSVPHEKKFQWGTTKEAFQTVYNRHKDHADWFLKADDDTYVIMENLRYLLSEYNPDHPLYLGRRFKPFVKQGFMSGGAGYVLSREALKRLVVGLDRPNLCLGGYEGSPDVEMGKCLEHLNVQAVDTRDHVHRERFMPFLPQNHIFPVQNKSYWYHSYTYYPIQKGFDCCSDYTITFHYVDPELMLVYEYFLYRLRPFGIERRVLSHNAETNYYNGRLSELKKVKN